ncbi:MAG: NADP-dependent oxidoreductase [Pseudomonadota bacterium]
MKAIRIHTYGDAGVLRLDDVPVPAIADDEVLIRVRAAGVNPVDWKIREGWLKDFIPHRLPLIPGWDVSGTVEKAGAGVDGFLPGDEVYTRPDIARDGGYAEYIAVKADEVAAKPVRLAPVEAASIPLAGITAWWSLVDVADIQPGQRVLIHAAAGGVGSLAVQIAKARGARVVATCSPRNADLVKSLGADELVNYRAVDFTRSMLPVDVVFDTVGGQTQEASWAVLKPGGLLVSIVVPPQEERARALGVRSAFVFIQPSARILRELAQLIDTGTVQPVLGATFPLAKAADAQRLSQTGHARGKIVLTVAS